jgi:hypothetical protein
MMEPQVAKWTRDYITKITFLSYRITAYNKREPVDTVYRGIVLNCSGRLTTFYNLDLVLHRTPAGVSSSGGLVVAFCGVSGVL